MPEENKSACKNCRHYVQHYVKTKTAFMSTYCEHCIRDKSFQIKDFAGFKHWEEM